MLRPLIRTTLVLAAAMTSIAPAVAQSPDQANVAADLDLQIDLEFGGGTVLDYLSAVKEAAGDSNLLIDLRTQHFGMGPVRLQSTALEAAVELVDGMTSEGDGVVRGIVVQTVGSAPRDAGYGPGRAPSAGRPIYRVEVVEKSGGSNTESRVWSLHDLIHRKIEPDAILTAIEAALELHEEFGEPRLKFHDETGLLIARAHPAQIQAIAGVIEQLVESRVGDENEQQLRARERELLERLDRSERERAEVTQHLLDMERRSAALQTTLNELETHHADLLARHKETSRELEVAEAAVRSLQEELKRTMDELNRLKRGGG